MNVNMNMFFNNDIFMPMFLTIFLFVEWWILFEKAGEKGWKVLIPFYGQYTICKIAKKEKIFWWMLGTVIAMAVAAFMQIETSTIEIMSRTYVRTASNFSSVFLHLVFSAEAVLLVILDIKLALAIAKTFGKSSGFGAGIAFLEPIFLGILAFDENVQYVKEERIDDNKEDEKEVVAETIEEVAEVEIEH